MIRKLLSHLGQYKRAAIVTPVLSALEAIMDVMLPTLMAFIIDQGISKGDMNAIVRYGLLTFAVALAALALGVMAGRTAATASHRLCRQPAGMQCMTASSIIPLQTSTSSPQRVLLPA